MHGWLGYEVHTSYPCQTLLDSSNGVGYIILRHGSIYHRLWFS